MGFEVDFLPVGEKKSGDAIAIRFGDLNSTRDKQKVVIIDGGFTNTGEDLVKHVTTHFKTDIVDLVVLTHPDNDHVGGLHTILEELEVRELWIHKAWDHTQGKSLLFEDGRITDKSIKQTLKESLESAHSLLKVAEKKNIPIKEPFAGLKDNTGAIEVLGPSESFFNSLLPGFSGLPETKETIVDSHSFFGRIVESVKIWFTELWHKDSIVDDGETTSPQNNSSAILQFTMYGNKLLFTGDAGREALLEVANRIGAQDGSPGYTFFQIPHHGSLRNVGPTVLNRLIGKIKEKDHLPHFTAFCSAAMKTDSKHPSKKVLNAFTRRGAKVHVTAGMGKLHRKDSPDRGWTNSEAEPFHERFEVEE